MDDNNLFDKEEVAWTIDGLKATGLTFVSDTKSIGSEEQESYEPIFVYQFFGENETVFGYEGLNITLNYSDATLYMHPVIQYEKIYKEGDIEPDDVLKLLKEQMPRGEHVLIESQAEFQQLLSKQKLFKPYGELLAKIEAGERKFQIHKVSESSPEFDSYLARIQTITLWYIEGAEYTDNEDEKWTHYLIYEVVPSIEGDGTMAYKFGGYATVYNFYAYPENVRPRIAQILILPQYRSTGLGPRFLESVFRDLRSNAAVIDITAEDPADGFIYLRDYIDSLNCLTLPEFAPDELRKGFDEKKSEAARKTFKISSKQSRRVYEILRLRCTPQSNKEEFKKYRLDVKRRIYLPMRKTENDWKKLNKLLAPEEISQVAAVQLSPEQTHAQLQAMFEKTLEEYNKTLDRIEKYPTIF